MDKLLMSSDFRTTVYLLLIFNTIITLLPNSVFINGQDELDDFEERNLPIRTKALFPSHHSAAINPINNQSKLSGKRKIENIFTDDNEAYETDGWSSWSLWSSCSRTCGGGISYSYRFCHKQELCSKGESTRYRICNMQPCPDKSDFRAFQCSLFNKRRYHGSEYEWLPYLDPQDPCSLTCIAKEYGFVVTFGPKFEDGTRCKEGSLDMCVSGICMPVGCDLQLGSSKKINECGVCDDQDKPCNKSIYVWSQTHFTDCSVSCGGGFQNSKTLCINKETEEEVDDQLCDESNRPLSIVRSCNDHTCPLRWLSEKWSSCTTECGGGYQTRNVYCVKDTLSGKHIRVPDHECPKPSPTIERSCNTHDCLEWFESPWSECTPACGNGTRTRRVVCRNTNGLVVDGCDVSLKPVEVQECSNGPCSLTLSSDDDLEDEPSYDDWSFFRKAFNSFSSMSPEPEYKPGEWSECSVTCGKGIRTRKVQCEIFLEFSKTRAPVADHECQDKKPPEVMECILPPCERVDTVDDELLNKSLEDIAFHKSSKLPQSLESAALALSLDASNLNKIERITYSWKTSGYTPCSAECLGGTQESIIQCVRENDSTVVAHLFCNLIDKPGSITKVCNDHPCLPRWNVTEYGECSDICGGGYQSREVECIHEVTRGSENTLVVPSDNCPQPKPETKRRCNEHSCPAQWKVEKWEKCSHTCGGGLKTRKIKCIKVYKSGHESEVNSHYCPKQKPLMTKRCNVKPCFEPKRPYPSIVHAKPQSIHQYIQQSPSQRVSIKVGGEVFVFKGTTLKIRCPRKRLSSNQINQEWFKDGVRIKFEGRYQMTSRGALRIKNINYQDEGVYVCSLGKVKANSTVFVKPRADSSFKRLWPEKNDKKILDTESNLHLNEMDKFEGNLIDSLDSKNRFKDTWEEKKENNKPGFISDQQNFGGSLFDFKKKKTELDDSFLNIDKNVARSSASSTHNDFMGQMKNFLRQKWTIPSHIKQMAPDQFKAKVVSSNYYLDDQNQDELYSDQNLLDQNNHDKDDIKYDWIISDWSRCSQKCGGDGFQVRASQCLAKVNNISKAVNKNVCIANGLEPPLTIRKCGLDECPKWIMSSWSDCSECIDQGLGVHNREVQCILSNLTQLSDDQCDEKKKPISNKTCVNEMCKPIWIADKWSNCSGECDQQGVQVLDFRCVWYGSESPAEDQCELSVKPSSTRSCLVTCEDWFKAF